MAEQDHRALEEGETLTIDWNKLASIGAASLGDPENKVVPVVVQDEDSKEVLVLAYTNEAAMRRTHETGILTLWSTSRKKFWVKGEESGNTFAVVRMLVNCEQNSLLYLVRAKRGGMCHTKDAAGTARKTCYYRRIYDRCPGRDHPGGLVLHMVDDGKERR